MGLSHGTSALRLLSSASMYRPSPKHHLKFAAAVATLIGIWFFSQISFGPSYSPGVYPPQGVHRGAGYELDRSGAWAPHQDALAPNEARPFCENFRLKPYPRHRNGQRKVYDLVIVDSQLETLEMRMGQMSPYVDYFVIMETDRTFKDKKKPLHVEENWARFKPWHHKMIRRTMDRSGRFSLSLDEKDRETSAFNSVYEQVIPFLTGEQEAFQDDVLLISEVDEFFKPETVKVLRNCETPERISVRTDTFYYSFQWLQETDLPDPQATTYRAEKTLLPEDLRRGADDYVFPRGAWRCVYCFSTLRELLGEIAQVARAGTIAYNKPEFKDPPQVVKRVRAGNDLFDRTDCTRIENNRDVPDYILANAHKYQYMLDRDPLDASFRDYNVTSSTVIEP